MTHVVLLSAGQGKRLSPLTDVRPKCLVPIAGKTLLEWQLQAIAACNVKDVTIVTGFQGRSVAASLQLTSLSLSTNYVFNPFYSVADNIGSCWAVRDLLRSDAVLINGDTLFDPLILSRLLREAEKPITVTIDRKVHYDDDDMKIKTNGQLLERIGKKLTGRIDGESIGMLRFKDHGGGLFVDAMEDLLHDPASLHKWYLSIIDRLAPTGEVGVLSIEGALWQEVDFPSDLSAASECVRKIKWPLSDEMGDASAVMSNNFQSGQL